LAKCGRIFGCVIGHELPDVRGVIIAVDRLLFTNADEQSAMVERVERPRQSWPDSQFRTPRLSQRNE
jgi:hypothetical protein